MAKPNTAYMKLYLHMQLLAFEKHENIVEKYVFAPKIQSVCTSVKMLLRLSLYSLDTHFDASTTDSF